MSNKKLGQKNFFSIFFSQMMRYGQKINNIYFLSDFDPVLVFFTAVNVINKRFLIKIYKKKNNLIIEIIFRIIFGFVSFLFKYLKILKF